MKLIQPPTKRENKGHYTPGIVSCGMLYISGQLSIDPDTGKIPEGGISAEAQQCFSNLDRVLKEAGCSCKNVVHCRIYLSNIENWDDVNLLYGAYFGEHKPARIVVPTNPLHFGCLMEIEAMAEMEH